jgi:outer membrane protein OmpA-like peptidoglycan-associated protein
VNTVKEYLVKNGFSNNLMQKEIAFDKTKLLLMLMLTKRKIIFKNMQFVGGRHKILEHSMPQLTELLSALRSNSKLKIAIEGHICCLEGNVDGYDFDTNTQDLSVRRAKAIYEYLVYAGIDENRLQYKGLGHAIPIYPYPEKDENEKTMNRRVEIKIIKKYIL